MSTNQIVEELKKNIAAFEKTVVAESFGKKREVIPIQPATIMFAM